MECRIGKIPARVPTLSVQIPQTKTKNKQYLVQLALKTKNKQYLVQLALNVRPIYHI